MTIHEIRLLGDPILRARCEAVSSPKTPAARLIARDLQETLQDLQANSGMGRGLAAPQVGAPMRVIYLEAEEPCVMFNPEIIDVGTEDFLLWDDCFSIPNLMVQVLRAHHIRVKYTDEQGTVQEIDAEGPMAELLQHEIDHLDGVLAVDRATGLDPFCLTSEWTKRHAKDTRYGLPFIRSESWSGDDSPSRYATPRDSLNSALKPTIA